MDGQTAQLRQQLTSMQALQEALPEAISLWPEWMIKANDRYTTMIKAMEAHEKSNASDRDLSPRHSPPGHSPPGRARSRTRSPSSPEIPGVLEQAINLVKTELKLSHANGSRLIEYLRFVYGWLQGPEKPNRIPDEFISDPQALLFFAYEHWKVSRACDTPETKPICCTMGGEYITLATCRINFTSAKYDKLAILRIRPYTLKHQAGQECPNGTLLTMAGFQKWNLQPGALREAGISVL